MLQEPFPEAVYTPEMGGHGHCPSLNFRPLTFTSLDILDYSLHDICPSALPGLIFDACRKFKTIRVWYQGWIHRAISNCAKAAERLAIIKPEAACVEEMKITS